MQGVEWPRVLQRGATNRVAGDPPEQAPQDRHPLEIGQADKADATLRDGIPLIRIHDEGRRTHG